MSRMGVSSGSQEGDPEDRTGCSAGAKGDPGLPQHAASEDGEQGVVSALDPASDCSLTKCDFALR